MGINAPHGKTESEKSRKTAEDQVLVRAFRDIRLEEVLSEQLPSLYLIEEMKRRWSA